MSIEKYEKDEVLNPKKIYLYGIISKFNFLIILELIILNMMFWWFLKNVRFLASTYAEQNIFYPINSIIIGLVLGIITLINCIFRKKSFKWLLLSIIIILYGMVAFYIGMHTPCCSGG